MKTGSLVEYNGKGIANPLCFGSSVVWPAPNIIYIVREIRDDNESLLLEEINNSHLSMLNVKKREPGFKIKYFRELLPPMHAEITELLEQPISI